ncbi:MAG TPA: hypothetical protein PKM88_02925 [bacterium]|nr:hypothetical protein [bacterium]
MNSENAPRQLSTMKTIPIFPWIYFLLFIQMSTILTVDFHSAWGLIIDNIFRLMLVFILVPIVLTVVFPRTPNISARFGVFALILIIAVILDGLLLRLIEARPLSVLEFAGQTAGFVPDPTINEGMTIVLAILGFWIPLFATYAFTSTKKRSIFVALGNSLLALFAGSCSSAALLVTAGYHG